MKLHPFSLSTSFSLVASAIVAFSGCLFQSEESAQSNALPSPQADSQPATDRSTQLLDDVSPMVQILEPDIHRLNGATSVLFKFNASDFSTDGEITPLDQLEYQYRLRAESPSYCATHLTDPFTEWTSYPKNVDPVVVGGEPPTLYNDLYSIDCIWNFTVRVRDPNGNIGTATHLIMQNGSGP